MNTLLIQTTDAQTSIQTHNGYPVVSSYGDVYQEYAAIRGSVGIFDFSSHGKFRISGDNHISWLSRLVSRDLEFSNSETVTFALVLQEQAEVVGIVSLYKYDDAIWLETETAERERIAAWLESQQEEDVQIEDISNDYGLIALEGPQSFKVVQQLINFEISSIPFEGFTDITWQGVNVMLSRTGYTGEYGYKLFIPEKQAAAAWKELHAQVQAYGGCQCGNEALEMTMIEVRQPVSRVEARHLPVISAGLGWLIDFSKADAYVGQEAINEQNPSTLEHRTVGFVAPKDAQIEAGDTAVLEGHTIGRVLIAFYSPTLDAILGLSYNKEPFTVSGLSWEIHTKDGAIVPAQAASAPYVLPKSWKIKML